MSESDSSKPATLVLIVMVALWAALLIAMRTGVEIPLPRVAIPATHDANVEEKSAVLDSVSHPAGDDEIAADEYGILQQVLNDFPQLTTVFEAAMVDGKMTYREAENILARKDVLELEAESGKQKDARERLMSTIERLRSQ